LLVVRRGRAAAGRVAKPQTALADRGGRVAKNPLRPVFFEEGSRRSSQYPILGM